MRSQKREPKLKRSRWVRWLSSCSGNYCIFCSDRIYPWKRVSLQLGNCVEFEKVSWILGGLFEWKGPLLILLSLLLFCTSLRFIRTSFFLPSRDKSVKCVSIKRGEKSFYSSSFCEMEIWTQRRRSINRNGDERRKTIFCRRVFVTLE